MDNQALLASWSQEFEARCNRVRQLIGSRHWLSDGRHKEEIIADHLLRYAPARWTIGSGFAVGHGDQISPEIDIHICDDETSPPLLADGSIRIVPAESVVAVLEIKSKAAARSFKEVAEHQVKCLSVLRPVPRSIWLGAFFFESGTLDFQRYMTSYVRRLRDEGLLSDNRKLCFAIRNKCVSFVESTNQLSAKIKTFSSSDLNFSIAICDLLAFLATQNAATLENTSIDRQLASINLADPVITRV